MVLLQNFKEAYFNLISSKLRSFLAVLGILVGTASVVAMVSSGELATNAALEKFKELGTDLLSISFYAENPDNDDPEAEMNLEKLSNLTQVISEITVVAPYTSLYQTLAFKDKELQGSVTGTTAQLQDILKIKLLKGRFISFLDTHSYFCVIGYNIYQQFKNWGYSNPIGQQIQIGDTLFTIIGIAAEWPENSFFNENINHNIIISIPASQLVSKYSKINNIIFRIKNGVAIESLEVKLKQFLNSFGTNYNAFVRSPQQIINSITEQRKIFTLLLGLIGSISLLVGGIGVMNIMLVSVVERRREIGIRRAVGAKKRDIQYLFLFESISLTLFGGFIGVISGIIISYIIAKVAGWSFTLFILPPVVGFTVSVAIGIFFGFYPAYKASQLDPIQALRAD